jgi:Tol biopolymer transport system component
MKRITKIILTFSVIIGLVGCKNSNEKKNGSSLNKNDSGVTASENIIAYYSPSDKSIYTLTGFKSKKKLITVEDGNNTWPIYSPDGNKIAFTGKVNGVIGTYTMDSETGQNLKMIFRQNGKENDAVSDWHSDGSLIYTDKNRADNAEVYTVIDSTNMRNLTNHEAWDFWPLSHSNDMISFWTSRDDVIEDNKKNDCQSLYTVNIDGTNLTKRFQIKEITNETQANGLFPAISSDGNTYVFMMNLDLYSINMDGSNLKNLTKSDSIGEYYPFFSDKEENRIYFCSEDTISSGLNIYSIDLEGNNKKQHTSFEGEEGEILFPKFKPTLPNKK